MRITFDILEELPKEEMWSGVGHLVTKTDQDRFLRVL